MKVYSARRIVSKYDYANKADYLEAYRDADKHYGYKARITGG